MLEFELTGDEVSEILAEHCGGASEVPDGKYRVRVQAVVEGRTLVSCTVTFHDKAEPVKEERFFLSGPQGNWPDPLKGQN